MECRPSCTIPNGLMNMPTIKKTQNSQYQWFPLELLFRVCFSWRYISLGIRFVKLVGGGWSYICRYHEGFLEAWEETSSLVEHEHYVRSLFFPNLILWGRMQNEVVEILRHRVDYPWRGFPVVDSITKRIVASFQVIFSLCVCLCNCHCSQ